MAIRGGGGPPQISEKLGQVLDYLLAGLGNLRSWQVFGLFRFEIWPIFDFVGRFRKSEKVGRFELFR